MGEMGWGGAWGRGVGGYRWWARALRRRQARQGVGLSAEALSPSDRRPSVDPLLESLPI